MADKNLEIQVKLTADTAGAQQAAAEIKRLADEANKKPFVMPIDEAGLKAREEAMKKHAEVVQKALEMPIDEAGMKAREEAMRLHAKAAQQEAAAQEQVTKETQKATAAQRDQVRVMAASTTTANGAAMAKKQLTAASSKGAQGFLMLSQAVEDAQYGLKAVVNNIPLMVMAFGGTAGLAATVSLAAVGVNILSEKLDIFGTAANKAREDAKKTSEELERVANQSQKAAEKSAALAESQKALEDAAKGVASAYDAQVKAADAAFKKQQQMLDAELKLADVTMERSMAQIDLQEAGGEISGSEATQRRSAVRAQASAKRDEVEMKRLQAEEDRFKQEADAAITAWDAASALAESRFSAANQQKILTTEERKAADELKKTQEAQMEAARAEMQAAKDASMPAGIMDPAQRALIESKMAEDRKKAEEKYNRASEALAETQTKIANDIAAQEASGTTNKGDFERQKAAEASRINSLYGEFESARESKSDAAGKRRALEETIPIRQETEAIRTAAVEKQRQRDEQQKQEQEAARQEERMRREREQVGTAGGRLASALQSGGASSAFVGQLQSAVAQTAAGGSSEQLMQLMQTLMANLSKMDAATREKLQKLQAEVNDLAVAK